MTQALKSNEDIFSDSLIEALEKTQKCIVALDRGEPVLITSGSAVNYSIPLESNEFFALVAKAARAAGIKGLLRSDIKKAIEAVALSATIDGQEVDVALYNERLDEDNPSEGVVLNMNSTDGKALVLSEGEVRTIDEATGITFRHAPTNGSLSYDNTPYDGESVVSSLKQMFSNLNDNQFALIMAYAGFILSHPRANGLTFPILYLHGNAGTGKTTIARLLTKLLGLGEDTVKAQPKDGRDLVATVSNNYLMCFDNCGGINDKLANALCSIATGGTVDDRKLYTNTDVVATRLHQPLIMTAISFPKQHDLCTRSLFVKAGKPKVVYGSDIEIYRKLDQILPQVQAWLLDTTSKAMSYIGSVQTISNHRAGDFNLFLAAFERAIGIEDQSVQQYVNKTQEKALNQQVVEHDEFLASIVNVVQQHKQFSGGPTEVHKMLMSAILVGMRRLPRNWPQNASALTGKLNRIKDQLAKQGVEILSGGTRGTNGRKLTLRVMDAAVVAAPETVSDQPDLEASVPSIDVAPIVESSEPIVKPARENYYVEELPEIDDSELMGDFEPLDDDAMNALMEEYEESEPKLDATPDWSQMSQEETDAATADFLG
ncbi:TPA: hypothetical protein ACQJO5_001928 [Vibrio parahaemolyticus]|nr:hypothetical protein [Vibrio parahaemolyticus]HAS3032605.1 hypothetical protein [Vibrio parahaemolyticus]HAS3037883.1 hypothetical protein [Vibrio parahaemolyticus]HAS3044089.1 hypothetical protein [Vibrio parahaemolyticus]HAS3054070.1 hypothetical protein [Vibrio parahaemolyticus]